MPDAAPPLALIRRVAGSTLRSETTPAELRLIADAYRASADELTAITLRFPLTDHPDPLLDALQLLTTELRRLSDRLEDAAAVMEDA
jgi:hypothetical protein